MKIKSQFILCMILTQSIIDFIKLHENDNTDKLLLSASKYPEINMPVIVDQIIARRQIKDKLPSWHACRELFYPSRLATEQCSSEITAEYKQKLTRGETLCDLTGGLGVDSFYFSKQVKNVIYVERSPHYCEAAKHNFSLLQANNIQVLNQEAGDVAESVKVDTFYIDPARRAEGNKRVFALSECEPDVLQLKPLLLDHAKRVIIKISPMADIMETLRLLPETTEIHVLSVKNECKELLYVLENEKKDVDPIVSTLNITSTGEKQLFDFQLSAEKETTIIFTSHIKKFLYEPDSSILKAGAFKLPAKRFNVEKLHPHSHLYTSDLWIEEFPGRKFVVDKVFDFSGKGLKQLCRTIPQANITTRNFNLSVKDLRQKSRITEGGHVYLFATTLHPNTPILIQCRK